MALALRLAILESHPTSLEAPSVLFVDDLLISLDMPFRRKIIEILLTYTNKFQTFIFTHDRAFYHLVASEIKIKGCQNDWKKYELYMQSNNGKQSLRAVLRTLIKIYTFAPNFKFGTK